MCLGRLYSFPEVKGKEWLTVETHHALLFQETEVRMCYASLDHNNEGKRRKPKKQKTHLSDKDGEGQMHAMDISLSKTTLVDSFPPESEAMEENIHDDPIRLFGLIRAQKESSHSLDYDLAQ